jgi:hypothetical protein
MKQSTTQHQQPPKPTEIKKKKKGQSKAAVVAADSFGCLLLLAKAFVECVTTLQDDCGERGERDEVV